jgi:predicted permease
MTTELRDSVRSLLRSPGFAIAAVAILALGIGANTAIFSLADAVILRPLPAVQDPAGLADLWGGSVSYPLYTSLRDGSAGTAKLAAASYRSLSLENADQARMTTGAVVSANYFDVLGVRPAMGRFFQPGEDEGGETVAVLADGLWQREFGADPAILGRSIRVNGVPVTVVGVAPEGFRGAAFAIFPDLWVSIGTWPRLATGPLVNFDIHSRNWGWLNVFGRLESGATPEQASAALLTLLRRDAAAHGEDFDAAPWSVVPTTVTATGANTDLAPPKVFALLAGAVLTALLIACANLANLFLARGAARQKEVALRQALGASRARIARQVLAESALLSLAGGAAGMLTASWILSLVTRVRLVEDITVGLFRPELGARAFAFAAVLSALVGLLFGLLPAWRASRAPAASILAASSGAVVRGAALNRILVAAQVALCLALLATSGLLGRSLVRAFSIDLGLQTGGVTVAQVNLGVARYDAPRALTFAAELPRRLEGNPSVRAASWTSSLPLSGSREEESIEIEGRAPDRGPRPVVDVAIVGPGYFRALGIPVVSGREFQAGDRLGSAGVAIVNRAMANRFWPETSPLGRRFRIAGETWTVVGVVADAKSASLTDAPVPQVWAPVLQMPPAALSGMTLVVKSDLPPDAAAGLIRGEVRGLDPAIPVTAVGPYSDVVASRLLPQRAGVALLGAFGVLSLVLAAVGIYAVVSWSTRRRTAEFGIRLVLGAQARDVRRLVLRSTAGSVVAGGACGLALSAAAGKALQGALYGLAPADPATLVGATLVLGAAALIAADLPARRAARIDPSRALRQE